MSREYHIVSSEKKITGESVISNDDAPLIHLSMTELTGGVKEYSIRAPIPLEREAIAQLIQLPVSGFAPLRLEEARDALRDITYPSRRIRALTRTAEMTQRLHVMQPLARELADVMTKNQDFKEVTVNVPIFKYSEAVQYAAKLLYKVKSEHKLLLALKSVGLDYTTSRKFGEAIFSVERQADDDVRALEAITGLSSTELKVAAILNEVDPRLVNELVNRLHEETFTGFREQPALDFYEFKGGSDQPTIFIRTSDVPLAYANSETNVVVGRVLRDKEKVPELGRVINDDNKEEVAKLDRRAVTFRAQADRHVAHPTVSWTTDSDGARSLQLSPSRFEAFGQHIVRPSSLAGLAFITMRLAKDMGIDYETPLHRVLKSDERTSHLGWAERQVEMSKLWPLVATHRVESLVAHSYFRDIERTFDTAILEDAFERS
jgi:hypothetical protein